MPTTRRRTFAGWQMALIGAAFVIAFGGTIAVLFRPDGRFLWLAVAVWLVPFVALVSAALGPRGPERELSLPEADSPGCPSFSVVSGRVRTPDGRVHAVREIVPTVFGVGSGGLESLLAPGHGTSANTGVASETVDLALERARAVLPGAEWVEWPAVEEQPQVD